MAWSQANAANANNDALYQVTSDEPANVSVAEFAGVFINNVTTSLPFRVVDVVTDSANSSGNIVEFIVKFNLHEYNYTTGA